MRRHKLTRRGVLRGTGGLLLGLPLLQVSQWKPGVKSTRAGAQSAFPQRFVVVFRANGTALPIGGSPDRWWPTQTTQASMSTLTGADGKLYQLNQCMSTLADVAQHLVVLKGLDLLRHPSQGKASDYPDMGRANYNLDPGEGHQMGMGKFLTARPLLTGNQGGGDGSLAGWASGISIDQHIANHVAQGLPHPSLQLGVMVNCRDVRGPISYAAANEPLHAEQSPAKIYQRIFKDAQTQPEVFATLIKKRQSVLDAVKQDWDDIQSWADLPKADKDALERHAAMIRDMEVRMQNSVSIAQCQIPAIQDNIDSGNPANIPELSELQIQLMVTALACNVTRVSTLQYSAGTNNIAFPFDLSYRSNANTRFLDGHNISHEFTSGGESFDELVVREKFYAGELGKVIKRLKAIPEAGGTLLDNTLILYGSEIAHGGHLHNDMPFVLAGGAGGKLKTGRYLTYGPNRAHNDLLVSIQNAFGVADKTFGTPEWCTGPLSGLFTT